MWFALRKVDAKWVVQVFDPAKSGSSQMPYPKTAYTFLEDAHGTAKLNRLKALSPPLVIRGDPGFVGKLTHVPLAGGFLAGASRYCAASPSPCGAGPGKVPLQRHKAARRTKTERRPFIGTASFYHEACQVRFTTYRAMSKCLVDNKIRIHGESIRTSVSRDSDYRIVVAVTADT
jgi:hypothetical protein